MAQKLEPVKRFKATDGRVIHMLNGKLHNWDDAAIIHPNGKKEYYLFGILYTKDEFLDRKREEKGIPPAKDPKYDSTF
jgi:hypothetical protein